MRNQLAEDRVLKSLARDDLDDLLGLDLDRFAGHGVTAGTGRTLNELNLADSGEHIALLFLLGALDREVDESLVNGESLLLGDAGSLSEGCHDSALGGGNDFFLSHFFDPFVFAQEPLLCDFVHNIPVFTGFCKGVNEKTLKKSAFLNA